MRTERKYKVTTTHPCSKDHCRTAVLTVITVENGGRYVHGWIGCSRNYMVGDDEAAIRAALSEHGCQIAEVSPKTKGVSRFERGVGKYTCRDCGKQTRETGSDESRVELCRACWDDANWENYHSDNHEFQGRKEDCPECKEEGCANQDW